MKKNLQKLDPCKRVLEIEIHPEEILSIEEEVYNDIQKVAVIAGFRKGKAPLAMVRQSYQKQAEKEIIQRSIPRFYQKAVAEERLSPIILPEIYDVDWQLGKPLVFKARFDVEPDVRLKSYKGLKVNKKKIEIKDEELDKVLMNLQEKHAELAVVEPRPLKKGDFILCDYKSWVGEKNLEAKENVWLSLEESANLAGFVESLWGANAGETKRLGFDLPQDFPDKDLQGKKLEMEVRIKEIKEKRLPVLDDAFARTAGKFNTLAELKAGIKQDLLSLKEIQSRKELEAKVLDMLVEANKFAIPVSLVDKYRASLENRFRQDLLRKGVGEEDVEKSAELIRKRAKEEADRQVKAYFLLDKIAQKEKIEVSDEELDRHIQRLAGDLKQDFDKVKRNLAEKRLLEELRLELREEKVVDFLLKNAQIVEE